MPEERKKDNKVRRAVIDHSGCDHPKTKVARRLCRLDHVHADCDHEQTQHARAWCTRRKNKAK